MKCEEICVLNIAQINAYTILGRVDFWWPATHFILYSIYFTYDFGVCN